MLDRLSVAVRPRSPWEAADLGLALLRAQAAPVARVWAAALLPAAAVLGAACWRQPWLAPLILWWLLPALGRPVLHVLAKATFGETPGLGETFRALPGYCRRGLAASLLWRRLSLQRSLLTPVWQLEAPSGAAFRRRRRVLLGRGRIQAQLLTCVCLLFTAALVLGALAAIAFFWPAGADRNPWEALFAGHGGRMAWLDALAPALAVLAMAVVEPFYLAAGFGLYLNRRVQLESWDLELAFRQLGQRARSLAARGAGPLLALLLALAPLGLRGQQTARPVPSPPKAALAEVLQAPEFSSRRPVWRLRLRHPPEPANPQPPPAWLDPLASLLGVLFRWLIPAAVVLALLYILWTHRRTLAQALGRPAPAPLPLPERIFGLDIRPAALPGDLAGTAARLWDQGDPRGALALLYRGALAHLVHGLRAPVTAGSTEGECRAQADRSLPEPAARYFTRLVEAWQGAAYGGRIPPSGDRELCLHWASHFPAPDQRP